MKFLVEFDGETSMRKPLPGAVVEMYDRVEVRTLPTFEAFDAKFGRSEGAWLSKGVNHRVETCDGSHGPQDCVMRDHVDSEAGWFIEVESLEQLIALVDEWGPVDVGAAYNNPKIRRLLFNRP